MNDLRHRKVEVDRLKLIDILKANKEKHVKEYLAAKAGYKNALLAKLESSISEARDELEKRYKKRKEEITQLTDSEIEKRSDSILLLSSISVDMKVPRSYAKEYDSAISIAEWDVRSTLELTHAEFTCFVRDEWDWKDDFEAVSKLYSH